MGKFYSVNTDLTTGLVLLLCGRAAEKGGCRKVPFRLQKAANTIPQGLGKLKPFPPFLETCLITGQVFSVCVFVCVAVIIRGSV